MFRILFIWILLLLGLSCATRKRCYEKWPSTQRDTLWLHDTVRITIPGSQADAKVTQKQLLDLKPGDSLVVKSKDGSAEAVIKKDTSTSGSKTPPGYTLTSRQKEQIITRYIKLPCPTQKLIEPPEKIIYKVPVWVWLAFGFLAAVIIYLALKRIL